MALSLWTLAVGSQEEDSERFPLSGVIANGISVRVIAGIDDAVPEVVKLDFETPGGEVAFRWFPKPAEAKIERSAALHGADRNPEDWGGWPFDAPLVGRRIAFQFEKTKYHWAVKVQGKRTPWFDFPVLTAKPITHVRIFEGFVDPEVIVSKPVCGTPCDASECEDGEGANTCRRDGEVADASNCFSRFPTESPTTANCSTAVETQQDGGNCCDGIPELLDIATAEVAEWVAVQGDEDLVGRSCGAFSLSESGCGALAGRPMRVEKVNTANLTLDCWAPPGTAQTLPYFALVPHTPIISSVGISRAQMNRNRDGEIDYSKRLITDDAGGLLQNWYVLAMHEKAGDHNSEPWVPVMKDRWDYWCDKEDSDGVQILMVDVGTELIDYVRDCTDLRVSGQTWRDRQGETCQKHRDAGWCTQNGYTTSAYRAAKPDRRQTFERNEKDDLYAPKACCGCGGGSLGGNLNTLPPVLTGKSTLAAQAVKALVK